MDKITIVTDSMANIPPELVKKYHIHVIPCRTVFGREVFRDGVDMTPTEFYRRLRESDNLPTTSTPSMGEFLELYRRLGRETEGIVSLHLSRELSATVKVAMEASRMLPDIPIRVIDCRTATMAQGFIVLEAARAAAAGASLSQVVERAEALIPKVNLFATFATLEYLQRGGRIGRAAALVGSVLQIRPIIYINEGVVDVWEKPRTRARAVRRIVEIMEEQVGANPLHAAVFHGDALEEAERLKDKMASRFNCIELYVTEFTPVMGAHTGPGLLGVAFYSDEVEERVGYDRPGSGSPAGQV